MGGVDDVAPLTGIVMAVSSLPELNDLSGAPFMIRFSKGVCCARTLRSLEGLKVREFL